MQDIGSPEFENRMRRWHSADFLTRDGQNDKPATQTLTLNVLRIHAEVRSCRDNQLGIEQCQLANHQRILGASAADSQLFDVRRKIANRIRDGFCSKGNQRPLHVLRLFSV